MSAGRPDNKAEGKEELNLTALKTVANTVLNIKAKQSSYMGSGFAPDSPQEDYKQTKLHNSLDDYKQSFEFVKNPDLQKAGVDAKDFANIEVKAKAIVDTLNTEVKKHFDHWMEGKPSDQKSLDKFKEDWDRDFKAAMDDLDKLKNGDPSAAIPPAHDAVKKLITDKQAELQKAIKVDAFNQTQELLKNKLGSVNLSAYVTKKGNEQGYFSRPGQNRILKRKFWKKKNEVRSLEEIEEEKNRNQGIMAAFTPEDQDKFIEKVNKLGGPGIYEGVDDDGDEFEVMINGDGSVTPVGDIYNWLGNVDETKFNKHFGAALDLLAYSSKGNALDSSTFNFPSEVKPQHLANSLTQLEYALNLYEKRGIVLKLGSNANKMLDGVKMNPDLNSTHGKRVNEIREKVVRLEEKLIVKREYDKNLGEGSNNINKEAKNFSTVTDPSGLEDKKGEISAAPGGAALSPAEITKRAVVNLANYTSPAPGADATPQAQKVIDEVEKLNTRLQNVEAAQAEIKKQYKLIETTVTEKNKSLPDYKALQGHWAGLSDLAKKVESERKDIKESLRVWKEEAENNLIGGVNPNIVTNPTRDKLRGLVDGMRNSRDKIRTLNTEATNFDSLVQPIPELSTAHATWKKDLYSGMASAQEQEAKHEEHLRSKFSP